MGKLNTGQFKLIPVKYKSIARVKEYEMLTMLCALLLSFCMNVPHQWKKEDKMVVFISGVWVWRLLAFWGVKDETNV